MKMRQQPHNASGTVIDLGRLEMEAKITARNQIANRLQRQDQLEKVDQIRKHIARKKGAVEAMLKTSMQAQLDGVRTGLSQLSLAQKDLSCIKDSQVDIDNTYRSIATLGDKLQSLREESSRHSQLAAAVENLKHIFNVPETVKKCQDFISDGHLLQAHKCLTELETSRNDLLNELHKQPTQSPTDKNTVEHYFIAVDTLAESLGKQLWLILQRTVATVRREPIIIVTSLRIVKREERTDEMMLKKRDQTGFLPPGRPREWKKRAFKALKDAVHSRVEGSQLEDRLTHKMWLVRHLEVLRQLITEDLRVVMTLCQPCFPPDYNIYENYVEMYHQAIQRHLNDLIGQGLEGNEIIALLTWTEEYSSSEMMANPDLHIDTTTLSPLLKSGVIDQLENQYVQTTGSNLREWMYKSVKEDAKDWYKDQEPDADEKGYFNTSLPIILFQMMEQHLQVASSINDQFVLSVVNLCVKELAYFINTYRNELTAYKDRHFADRSQPQYFLPYMIANVNNCAMFEELLVQLGEKYSGKGHHPELAEVDQVRLHAVKTSFNKLGLETNEYLLLEVFMDLESQIQSLITREWLAGTEAVQTICITVEDYCQDFVHLRTAFYDALLVKVERTMACEYLKALFGRKMTFKNYDERFPAADKICKEADQLQKTFVQLKSNTTDESPLESICLLTEIIKLKDTSMMTLEIAGIVAKFPDVKSEQLISLLLMREDMGRSGSRQIVIDSLGEDHDSRPKPKKTIFSEI